MDVNVIFVLQNGEEKKVKAKLGKTLLQIAHENHLPLEGACGGSLACSTCHVVIDENYLSKIDEALNKELLEVSDQEEALLDMVPALETTSRLGCQIKITKAMDGMKLKLVDSINF